MTACMLVGRGDAVKARVATSPPALARTRGRTAGLRSEITSEGGSMQTTTRARIAVIGLAVGAVAVTAMALIAGAGGAGAATAIPAHVYAPYFETWTSDGIKATSDASGVKYMTLAFLETTSKTSCTLAWNGVKTQTVADGRYLSDIASLRAAGGDVI